MKLFQTHMSGGHYQWYE